MIFSFLNTKHSTIPAPMKKNYPSWNQDTLQCHRQRQVLVKLCCDNLWHAHRFCTILLTSSLVTSFTLLYCFWREDYITDSGEQMVQQPFTLTWFLKDSMINSDLTLWQGIRLQKHPGAHWDRKWFPSPRIKSWITAAKTHLSISWYTKLPLRLSSCVKWADKISSFKTGPLCIKCNYIASTVWTSALTISAGVDGAGFYPNIWKMNTVK